MYEAPFALDPARFIRSVEASRATVGLVAMKLVDLVPHVRALVEDAPFAVVGGLAQILWARKTHTDDLDLALASTHLAAALTRVQKGAAPPSWKLPTPPDVAREANDVFEVCHLLHDGAVVDLLSFRDAEFMNAILATAREVPELGGARFITPELLLVTQLLRPGPSAALAAVELILARRAFGGLDLAVTRRWADQVGRGPSLDRAIERAAAFDRE